MQRNYLKGLVLFLLIFFGYSTLAIAADDFFDVNQANRILDKLSIQLSIQNLNVKDLQHATNVLTKLQERAQECVDDTQSAIDTINKLWQESTAGIQKGKPLTEAQQYLKNKKEQLMSRRSECRLFVLRSNDAITAFSKTAKQLTTKKLLEVKLSFFRQLVASAKLINTIPKKFNRQLFLQHSGIRDLNVFNLVILFVGLVIAVLLGIVVRYFAHLVLAHKTTVETFAEKLHLTIVYVCAKYTIPLLIFLVLAIFTTIIDSVPNKVTYLAWISYGLLAYVVALTLICLLFYPVYARTSITGIAAGIARSLVVRLQLLCLLILCGFVIYILFHEQSAPLPIIGIVRTIFITLLAISLISLLWLINRIPRLLVEHRILQICVNLVLTCGLLAILIAEWMGYQLLVTYILRGIALTLVAGFVAWMLSKLVITVLQWFSGDVREWQKKFRYHLGIKRQKIPPEFIWLSIIFYVLIWGAFLIVLLKIWVLSNTAFRSLMQALTDGFKIGGLTIIPSRILSAFIFFIIVFLLIRVIKAILERRAREDYEPGAREALAAIISYIGIAITVLIALLIGGVNFAGLAIIAGALSVGIGFGLQNVVSNFVSGIVLLLERPIKPGDRITVGEIEGFVEKIRILTTQIKTLQFSDLIVPNAEITSKKIDNLMFHDFQHRLNITVGVAYGSNIELVKQVMLEIANNHPEIVKGEGLYQPIVFFKEFGESALIFQLRCVIRNVNIRFDVQSEINFMIDKVFREKGITIAFPQQDIHIKDWPGANAPG